MADKPDPRSGLDEHGGWTRAFPGQRPPFEPGNEHAFEEGNEVPLQHGVYSERRLLEAAEQEYAQLRSTFTPWDPAYDLPARTLAEIRARTVLAYRWLDVHDLVDDRDEVRAILKELPRWERRATELYRELALTVRSRVELDLDRIAREHGMIELAEAKDLTRRALELAGRYITGEDRAAFLRDVRAFLVEQGATDGEEAIEGSARRLEPGSPVEEEGRGVA